MRKPNWLGAFILWRMALFAIVAGAVALVPFRSFLQYAGLENIAPSSSFARYALHPWANFDGVHYLQIAGQGYTDQARFLPLLPIILRAIYWGSPLSSGQVVAALIFTNLCFVGALWFFYRLLRLDYTEKIARWSVVFLVAFPTSFFFVSVYTESLFLLLSAVSLYAARRHQWLTAIGAAMLLSVTRLTGVLIILPLAIEYFLALPPTKRSWKQMGAAWWLLLPVLPVLIYAYYNFTRWGDPLQFVHGHGVLANGRAVSTIVLPFQTIYRYGKILLGVSPGQYEFWLSLAEVCITLMSGWILWLAYKLAIRPSLTVFAALLWLVPVLSGTFSGMPRYVALLLPLYVVLAHKTPARYRSVALAVSFCLQLLAASLFARGYLIG